MKIVGVVIARMESGRLPNKNIRTLKGKPLIFYALDAMEQSKHISEMYVTTESKEIKDLVKSSYKNVQVVDRPPELAKEGVPSQDVFKHFAGVIDFDVMVNVQSNSPQVKVENIDAGIDLLLDHDLWEVRSVDERGLENGAFWILTRKAVFWDGLSVYFGVSRDDAIDIHTFDDLDSVRREMEDD